MFFLMEREDKVPLHPKYFGPDAVKRILDELKKKVEGKATGRFGFTILVTKIQGMSPGHLDDTTGFAHYTVRYLSVVFRPFRNEVLFAEVSMVNQNGFFAQAGPLQIFVSKLLMPSDYRYDSQDSMPNYVSEDGEVRVGSGSMVRVRIVGIRLATDDISVIGTIKEDYLGPVED
eukprot:31315_1